MKSEIMLSSLPLELCLRVLETAVKSCTETTIFVSEKKVVNEGIKDFPEVEGIY